MTDTADEMNPLDVYDALGLERSDSTSALLDEVRFLRAHWTPRAHREGAMGEEARANLFAIASAEQAFASDASRRAYDRSLVGEDDSDFDSPSQEMSNLPQIDFYDVLSLDREASTEAIRDTLAHSKSSWLRRSTREGVVGEQARAMLESIEAAETVFASDAVRADYDRRLGSTARLVRVDPDPDANPTERLVARTDTLMPSDTLKPADTLTPVVSPPPVPVRTAGAVTAPAPQDLDATVVNLYDELTLNRDDATNAILSQLQDELRPSWQARASRAGKPGEQARAKLEFISLAESIFSNDESRDQYDLQLRQRPEVKREDAQIDWLGIAWNYYFINDIGAASVAARKAREQSPDEALPYVVTAWVELAQDEAKRAKQNADEAFVLDELGEDTADVHHVRGAVYYAMGQYDRAIDSFDRALAKATPGEACTILLHKAWAQEDKKDIQGMIGSCIRALSNEVELPTRLRARIEETTYRAIARKCYVAPDNALQQIRQSSNTLESLSRYQETRKGLLSSGVVEPSRAKIITFIDERLQLLTSIRNLENDRTTLAAVSSPNAGKPDLPIKSAGAGALCLLLTGVHAAFLVCGLILLGFAAYVAMQRSEWTSKTDAYNKAQKDLAEVTQVLARLRSNELQALTARAEIRA